MRHGINKIILIGRLGNQPEFKSLNNGGGVVNLSIATSESWKDKTTGGLKEVTEWHRVVLYGQLAQRASDYLNKGERAYFEGKLQTRKWLTQSGENRYTTEIIVNSMQMLTSKKNNDYPTQERSQKGFDENRLPENRGRGGNIEVYSVNNIIEDFDDIPF